MLSSLNSTFELSFLLRKNSSLSRTAVISHGISIMCHADSILSAHVKASLRNICEISLDTSNDYKFHLDNFYMVIQLSGVFLNFVVRPHFIFFIWNVNILCPKTCLLTLSKTIIFFKKLRENWTRVVVKVDGLKCPQVKSSIKIYCQSQGSIKKTYRCFCERFFGAFLAQILTSFM